MSLGFKVSGTMYRWLCYNKYFVPVFILYQVLYTGVGYLIDGWDPTFVVDSPQLVWAASSKRLMSLFIARVSKDNYSSCEQIYPEYPRLIYYSSPDETKLWNQIEMKDYLYRDINPELSMTTIIIVLLICMWWALCDNVLTKLVMAWIV